MKASIKQLASKFSEFIGEDLENTEGKMREFYATTFRCNNSEIESEILDYWIKH